MNPTIELLINIIYASVLAGAPLLYGTLGEILTQKSGNLNLGVEGMMYMGAVMGFYAGYVTGDAFLALVAAFAAGAFGALIYCIITVTLKANQNVTGLTLTIFGTGFANLVGESLNVNAVNRSASLADSVKNVFRPIFITGLSDIPYLGKLFFQYNIFVYLGIAIAILMGLYTYNTRKGLNLSAVGENPSAADAAGISVSLYKYLHTTIGGGICGLGGAYVAIITCGGAWTYNSINGLGWIAVALVIFAAWNPYRALLGAIVFGALSILRLYIPSNVVQIPIAIFAMLPYIATILVLVITSINMSKENAQPKSCGLNYFREER